MYRLVSRSKNIFIGITILALIIVGYGGYRFFLTNQELENTKIELSDTLSRLNTLKEERDYIYDNLLSEQAKNTLFENQIKEIAGTVGVLDKLSKTDKELLQKYSKVYFLNEHYVPDSLATVTPEYVFEVERVQKVHAKAWPFLESMIKAGREAGVELKIVSAYRSFGDQSVLKGAYTVTYGSGANKFSADQGYSEHQLGTAIDFTTEKLGAGFTQFDETLGYQWLVENAYKYGFTLSYPKGNSYYLFEPWHWRFVGTKLALRLHEEKENFYDLDQRIIDNYLISIFN